MEILKKYASFLRKNYLEEVTKENLAISLPMKLPIMKYFEHLSPEELQKLSMKGLDEFLQDLENDTVLSRQEENLIKFENDELPDFVGVKIETADLVLGNGAQNLALQKFIPKFTQDISVALEISAELSKHYTQAQNAAFEVMERMRKKTEQALVLSEERFRAISQSAGDAIVVYDLDLKIDFWNVAAEKMFGYTEADVIGQSCMMLYPEDKREEYIEYNKNFKLNKEERLKEKAWQGKIWEIECVTKSGNKFPVEISLSFFETSKGSFFAVIIHNITERKEAAENLEEQARRLYASNEELEQFAYVASHDLKEPLRMVSNYVQLLEKRYTDKFDAEGREYIKYAVEGTMRMRSLINDLLEYSRVNRAERKPEQLDLNKTLEDVKINLHELIADKHAELIIADLPTITGDRVQLAQLFQNLIGNSMKFIDGTKKPVVEVSCESEGGCWKIGVKDNGIGIDVEFSNKLFKMFQRLHTREEYPGTGIGLAICKKIVERHKGKIWFESKLGEGTTFYFTLPK